MKMLKSTVPIEKFTPHIIANTVGKENDLPLPEAAAVSFLRNAMITFAEKSGALTEQVTVDLQCGMDEYLIEALHCETVIGVKDASMGEFHSEDCGTRWCWGNVTFTFNDDDMLTVYPVPTTDIPDGLDLTLILAPSRDACEVDSKFYDKWFEHVINGALSEIHLMPNQPWSSVSRGDYRRRLFVEGISDTIVRKVTKGVRAPMHMSPNPNWTSCRTSQRRW